MATENKTVLLKFELDTAQLQKNSKEAEETLKKLKEQQAQLKAENKTGTVEYAKLSEEIRINQKALKDNASAIAISEIQSKKLNVTEEDLIQRKKALSIALKQMTQDERENSAEGQRMVAELTKINEGLNNNLLVMKDGSRNVGLYADSIVKAYKELDNLKKNVNQIGYAYGQTKKEIDENKKALDDLSKSGQAGTQAYIKLQNETEELTEILGFQEMALKGATDEMTNHEAQLKATEKEARKIGYVYGEVSEATNELGNDTADLNAKFEDVYGDVQPLTGRIGELEDRLYELALAGETNSDKFREIQAEVVKMKQAVIETDKATDALAENKGISGFAGLIGETGERLLALDFDGATQRIDALRTMTSKTDFKSMIAGAKNLGSGLLDLGKVILTNPLFLLAGVITGVVMAIISFTDETEELEAEQERFNKTMERQNNILRRNNETIMRDIEQRIRMRTLEGASIEDLAMLELEKLVQEEFQRQDEIEQLAKSLAKKRSLYKKYINEGADDQARSIKDEIEAEKVKFYDLQNLNNKFAQDLEYLNAKTESEIAKRDEEAKKEEQERAKENFEKAKKKKEDELALAKEIADRIKELQLEQVELSAKNEEAIINKQQDFKKRIAEETITNQIELGNALLTIEKERFDALAKVDETEKQNQIDRLNEQLRKEKEALKGSKEQIAIQSKLLEENTLKEIEAINIDFQNKAIDREKNLSEIQKGINESIIENAKTVNEQRLIELEAELLKQENELKKAGKKSEQIAKETADAEIEIAKQKNKIIQDDQTKTVAEKLLAEQQYQAELLKIQEEAGAESVELQKKQDEEKEANKQALISATQQLVADAFNIAQNQIQEDLERTKEANQEKIFALENQYSSGLISKEKYDQQRLKLEQEAKREEAKLNKKAFEVNKIAQLTNATINTAVEVSKVLANPILAGIVAGLGAVQIALIASQPTPAFAKSGKVLSGQKIGNNDGQPILRSNGDNLLATVKVGEVVLNERHQAMLGGDETFRRIGVPGFADSGLVGGSIASNVDARIETENSLINIVRNIPNPVVFVEDINTGQSNVALVESAGNI